MKYGTASLWSFGLLMLPGTALAAWGENWGEMAWGLPVSVPGVPGLGLIALALALSATAAWLLRKRRTALGLPVLLVLLAVPLVVVAGTVSVPNTFVNGAVADADEVNANFDSVETAVNDNDSRITAAETESLAIAGALATEEARALAAEAANSADLDAEVSRALAAEAVLSADLSAEATRAGLAEGANSAAISAEETRALAAEAVLSASIASVGDGVDPATTSDYIIHTDGSVVYAKNGTTGEQEYADADAATVIQDVIDGLVGPATLTFRGGVYDLSTTVALRSDLILLGYGATLLKNTAGYPLIGTGVSNVTVAGFTFDLAGQGWEVYFSGNEAQPLENILVRDCSFLNAGPTWSLLVNYEFPPAPGQPSSANKNIRIINNVFDGDGATGTLELALILNVDGGLIEGNVFKNTPTPKGAALSVFGYNRNIQIRNNQFHDNAAPDIYIQQSERVTFSGNIAASFVRIVDSRDVLVEQNQLATVQIIDYDAETFDGHQALFRASASISINNNHFSYIPPHESSISLVLANNATNMPRDITISGNHARSRRIFVQVDQIPTGALDALSELFITGNHVVWHEAFNPIGVIHLNTNAAAAQDDGLRNVVISNNRIVASSATPTPWDVWIATPDASNIHVLNNFFGNNGVENAAAYDVSSNITF